MKNLSVSIIIPNWNGEKLLEKNLPQIIAAGNGAEEFIVVDDGSTDGSVQLIKRKFTRVKLIAKPVNEGYSSTVNLGVKVAVGDVVVLVNTDVIPEKDFLKPLLKHFEDSAVFAVGCEDKSEENGLTVLRGRGEAAWKKGFFIHWRGEIDKTDTAWVSGGSGAFRKSVWDKLGGMDTLFNPFYWEDIDLSYRALKSGYKLIFEPQSRVSHLHEEGKITSSYTKDQIAQVAYRNQFIFIWKNLSDATIIIQHLFWTPIRLLQSLISEDMNMIVGFFSAVVKLPGIIISRTRQSPLWKKGDISIFTNSDEIIKG